MKSRVEIEDAVYVHIIGRRSISSKPSEQPGLRFEVAEDGLLRKFLEWLIEHPEIDHFPGGSSGLGNYQGWFPAEHRPAIEAFFREQGVMIQ